MANSEKLKELLEGISDAYPDFVFGISLSARKYNLTDKMIDLIESNPDITTSEIIDKISEFEGIRKVCIGE